MESKIDYTLIMGRPNAAARAEAFDAEAERVGYVSLTDAYLYYKQGGFLALQHLEKDERDNLRTGKAQKFKIKCICDEWGKTYKPGDTITRKIQKPLRDRAGHKLRNNYVQDLKRRGTFEKKYIDKREFLIDEYGCISCYYDDAGWFLSEYGVHHTTGEAITGRRELSSTPCKMPNGGLKHIHYWRFSEVLPGMQLEKVSVKGKGKGGRKKKEVTGEVNTNPQPADPEASKGVDEESTPTQ